MLTEMSVADKNYQTERGGAREAVFLCWLIPTIERRQELNSGTSSLEIRELHWTVRAVRVRFALQSGHFSDFSFK